ATRTRMWAMPQRAVNLSKPCCGLTALGRNGAYCLRSMGSGIVSINASGAGAIMGCGSGCWRILPTSRTWKTGWWTAPLSALMRVQRAPQKNGGQAQQALGRSRGGFSTKVHVTVDALGNPLRVFLTAGQRHDLLKAHELIVDLAFEYVIADRSY